MAATDNVIFVNTNSTAVTLTLPAPTNGRVFEVKDSTGNAAVNNITISQHSSETIDGSSTYLIKANYGYLRLVSDGTNWFTSQYFILASASAKGILSSTDWSTFNSKQPAGNYITALTGDATASGPGSAALTLATVNANVGSFGSSTSIPSFTVNAKGLITAASGNAVVAPAGTLTGTTLAANVLASSLTSVGILTAGTWNATTIAINHGGTGVTSVTTAPTANAFAGWDANSNLSANSFLDGYATTPTAAGTTTLTVGSAQQQYFTGSTTQTVLLPVASTLALGQSFTIVNNSTGVVTVQSSGGNTLQAMSGSSQLVATLILTSGTTAASWSWLYTASAATNAITALTGDATATGPGSVALTLATVNANVGTFASVTVNGKGLVTAAAALSGDATTSGAALTLATVNANVGSFGSSTAIPNFTVNAKGLITAASTSVVIAPAGTLTGTTLAANVVSSSLTSVGTLTSLQVSGLAGIGGVTNTSAMLRLGSGSNPLTLASQYAAETGFSATSAATTEASGFVSFVGTAAAAFTCARVMQFYATNGSVGAGSTITNQIMYMADVPTSGTNNAILADNSSFSGNFFINQSGTAASTFGGKVGISGAAGSQALLKIGLGGVNSLSGTSQFGVDSTITGTSAATSLISGFIAQQNTAAAAFTCSLFTGFYSVNQTKGAGSTITRQVSYFSDAPTQGANTAILADNSSFSGNYAINFTSSNPSVFASSVTANSVVVGSAANTIAGLAAITCNVDRVIFTGSGSNSTFLQTLANTNTSAVVYARMPSASTTGSAYFVAQQDAGTKWSMGIDLVATSSNWVLANTDGFATSSAFYLQASTTGAITLGAASGTQTHAANGNLNVTKSLWVGGSQDTRAIITSGNSGNPLTGADQWAYVAEHTGTSAATTTVIGFRTVIGTAAASFTCPEVSGVHIGQHSKGSGSTITYALSYFGSDQSAVGATNSAIISDNTSFSGSYALNFTSGKPSKLGGYFGVGLEQNFAAISVVPASMTTALSTTNAEGVTVDGAFPSTATNSVTAFNANATTTATSYTLNVLEQFVANNVTAGAGSTITRTIQFRAVPPTSGGTGNCAFGDNATFTGSWSLNFTSTNPSSLTGALCHVKADVASAATITALSSTNGFVRLTGSTATSLQGIVAGQDGQMLVLFNNSGQNLTIQNENAGATAANRIQTNTGADVTSTGNSAAIFIYDVSQSRWIMVANQP